MNTLKLLHPVIILALLFLAVHINIITYEKNNYILEKDKEVL